MKKFNYFRLLFRLWAVLIFILSIIPYQNKLTESTRERWIRADYVEHLILFFILSFLFVFWKREKINYFNSMFLLYLVFSLLFAVSMEFIQIFVPNRTFNVMDMLYNAAGIILGLFISFLFRKKFLLWKRLS